MLETRWHGISICDPDSCMPHVERRLERVVLESANAIDFHPHTKAALRGLFEDGMELVLTNGYTSWIHDNWIPISSIIKQARKYPPSGRTNHRKPNPSGFQAGGDELESGTIDDFIPSSQEPANADAKANAPEENIPLDAPSSFAPTANKDINSAEDDEWIPNRHLGRHTYHYPLVPPLVHPYSMTTSPLGALEPPSYSDAPFRRSSSPAFVPYIEGIPWYGWSDMTDFS
jgi:hypothetical protein